MHTPRRLMALLTPVLLAALSTLAGPADQKPPADLPDTAESAKLAPLMPKTVSGTVFLDGKPLPGARVTDGVDFVTTDKDGKYTITLKPDPAVPYLPSRTVSVCWPSGTWPEHSGGNGRWTWWARLKDVAKADPAKPAPAQATADFRLVSRAQKLPICLAHGTDPHDAIAALGKLLGSDRPPGAGRRGKSRRDR